jgi:UDP-3-O-[3-hydroxymyristoyl] N-acetylglucosamine deacetylase
MQRTLKREANISGKGLFTGEPSRLKLLPASPGPGIVFQRVDLPGKPKIPARLAFVKEAVRTTCLATKEASLNMVEHLLSAFSASGIDNALIEAFGPETPACDGSAKAFVDLLEEAGIALQDVPRNILKIAQPVYWSSQDVQLVALPSDELRISYTLHYPGSTLPGSQFYTFPVHREQYKTEIAPCRTFSLYEEIAPFIEKGYIRGGGLENAVVIKEGRVLNPEGTRFSDEMVRHKILDLIGDLSLIGRPLQAHIIAIRSGHASNVAFAKELEKYG